MRKTVRHSQQPILLSPVVWTLVLLSTAGASPGMGQTKAAEAELDAARSALKKYEDPYVAVHDGYFSSVGCVVIDRPGAAGHVPYQPGGMGIHFINLGLLGPVPDPAKPQVLIYEPGGNKLRLIA